MLGLEGGSWKGHQLRRGGGGGWDGDAVGMPLDAGDAGDEGRSVHGASDEGGNK